MNALPFILGALCVMAIFYRYYSAFLAAKVLALDGTRTTPAHVFNDGQNYQPTNKWVLFGHHFAAIAGAGPLIGPTLAAQFGFLPGFLWLLIGVVIGGAVHDFVSLAASLRRNGRSLAEIARVEISPLASIVGSISILIIIIVSLAGLGLAVVNALYESSWGTFTIAMTIPIAVFVGLWMYRIRPGHILEGSAIGVISVLLAVVGGAFIPGSFLEQYFLLSRQELVIALALYGFAASVLPVWLLLVPRDYLSSYMKLGTVLVLIIGVIVVAPELKMPSVTDFIHGGGPIIPGTLFPFMFITIACGAISGFHSLVATGTTPKMVGHEPDARMIGYGAMLMEGIVGIVALIAACSLHPGDYYAINLSPEKFQQLGMATVNLDLLSAEVGEQVAGRPGGAVSLAVGFAQIFTALPGMTSLMSYWYHFAIMFEALFILTTIDAGTRVGRFLVQEFVGKAWKP
ncbi:MAG: carbon starvation protein CstA, partial [Ignavibacteria bacterium GWC2_56_12]